MRVLALGDTSVSEMCFGTATKAQSRCYPKNELKCERVQDVGATLLEVQKELFWFHNVQRDLLLFVSIFIPLPHKLQTISGKPVPGNVLTNLIRMQQTSGKSISDV